MTGTGGESEARMLPRGRLNAFADGVFAIAITLLVLEIPVPEVDTGLWGALVDEWPSFLAYLISFAFIGAIWIGHAGVSKLMKRADSLVFRLNLLLLFFVSLLPFTTSLMATHLTGDSSRLAVVAYGVNLLLASSMLSIVMWYTARNTDLVIDDIADEELRRFGRRRRITLAVGALGVAVGIVLPQVAVTVYVVETVLIMVLPLYRVRHVDLS